jgi:hypothetical protein
MSGYFKVKDIGIYNEDFKTTESVQEGSVIWSLPQPLTMWTI